GGAERENRRRIPGRFTQADRLSRGAGRNLEEREGERFPEISREPRSESDFREAWLHGACHPPGGLMDWLQFSPDEWEAIRLSLRVATVGTLASIPLGLFVAYALARWRFPGKFLVDGLVHLPLVLPPVVTGYILLLLFGRKGPIGAFLDQHFGIVFSFRWTGAALAASVMGFPLMVRAIRLAMESIDERTEQAAA